MPTEAYFAIWLAAFGLTAFYFAAIIVAAVQLNLPLFGMREPPKAPPPPAPYPAPTEGE